MKSRRLALVGDYSLTIEAHLAIPSALALAAQKTSTVLTWEWIGSATVRDARRQLEGFAGVWCVPGSPYASMTGALEAIRFARETGRPFLGTCGGFQHALIEIARDVLGIRDADHTETNPQATEPVVSRLSCSLVGQRGQITFAPGSQLAKIFDGQTTLEEYRCSYGFTPAYRARFEQAGLRFTGFDTEGQTRACEWPTQRFFVGTLFQPERAALQNRSHPLVEAFVAAIGSG